MAGFDDDDMPPGLTSVSSPTLSAASDIGCEEDDGFNEDVKHQKPHRWRMVSPGSDNNIPRDHAIVISSSNSSSTLSIGDSNPEQLSANHFNIYNDVPNTAKENRCDSSLLTDYIDIDSKSNMSSYYNQISFIPTESSVVNNMDQINNHMERVNLSGGNTASNIPGILIPGINPTTSSAIYSTQNINRPSAIIRPNIHALSTSKRTGFITGQNRITSIRKPKRLRTAFNSHQLMGLETEYSKTRYIDRNSRTNLANALSLSENAIKIWFQNRRMKEKKDKAVEEFEETEHNDSSKTEITNDNKGYQFPTTVNFNQGSNILHHPSTPSHIQPAVNMNNLITPNYSVYIPNTQNYQPPVINQFYQMASPQLLHQQPYIQMQQQVFRPQQWQNQQMPIQQIIPPMMAQQMHMQKHQGIVPTTTENVFYKSVDKSTVKQSAKKHTSRTMISRLTFEEDSL